MAQGITPRRVPSGPTAQESEQLAWLERQFPGVSIWVGHYSRDFTATMDGHLIHAREPVDFVTSVHKVRADATGNFAATPAPVRMARQ